VGDEIPVQLGGGIRDLDTIERYLDDGLSYVIIGTAAVKNPGFLKDACSAFGGHIIVGLDAKDGKVATDGWSKLSGHEVIDLAKKFEDYGVEAVIYTDIGRDGMLTGINIDATVKLAQALSIPVIASGGLSNLADIERLCAVEEEGVEGVICGRAIYSGDLDFAQAQKRADELNGGA
jgi:phosphoribosylformimino-5-aminoimidazole carboxamide ribotide isomerase